MEESPSGLQINMKKKPKEEEEKLQEIEVDSRSSGSLTPPIMAEMEEMKSQVRTMKGEMEEGWISMEGKMQKMFIEEGEKIENSKSNCPVYLKMIC